jgi:hypothetical protein
MKILKSHYFFLITLCLLLLISCTKNKEINLPKNYKEHRLPINEVNIHKTIFKQVKNRNATYFTHREKTGVLYVYDFDSSKITETYILSKSIGKIDDYAVYNDTFYALIYPYGVAIQPLNNLDGYHFYYLPIGKMGLGNYLNVEPDGLHVNIMGTDVLVKAHLLKAFFNSPVDALVKFEGDSMYIKMMQVNYPKGYENSLNIDLTYVVKCVTPKRAYYSFSQSPEVYYVQNTNVQKVNMNSNYFVKMPDLDSLKLSDDEYRYGLEGSTFMALVYNPIRKELYRSNYHSQEGVVNKIAFANTWSIVVADDEPKVKYEILCEPMKYLFTRTIPTRKGFALVVAPDDIETKNKLILHEYELE